MITFFNMAQYANILSYKQVDMILLDKIRVPKYNIRIHDITKGIDDLAASIKAVGLLQPITVYLDSENGRYVVLAGQRRLNAFGYLNKKHPSEGFDKIACVVVNEPATPEEKLSLSLAENITQLPMNNSDLVKAVTDLYNNYHDYDLVREKFGLTKYMVDKYVKLARLPERLKTAINEGEISPNPKKAETASLGAVDALQYVKGGSVDVNQVLELAKEFAKPESDTGALKESATKGGNVKEIAERARKKTPKKHTIHLTTEVAEKLQKVAKARGESENDRASQYVAEGVTRDYHELDN